MSTNKKVLVVVGFLLVFLSLATMANVAFNFMKFGQKSADEKAHSIAESVRDSLTSHMVNGTMDKRFMFLDNMMRHQEVENLRVLRSKNVIEQFGKGHVDVYQYDDIEKKVIKNAQSMTKIYERNDDIFMRVTIPYIATKYSNPNCLQCHTNAKEGDVLGVISMDLDISDVKDESIDVILRIMLITIVFLLIAMLIGNHYINPYVKLFDDLEAGISKAYRGDFSHHVKTNLSNEAGEVAERLNELSEIFRFKKTIELDPDKGSIYRRLAHVLKTSFGIENFVFMEIDIKKKERKVIYETRHNWSDGVYGLSSMNCRAFRTSTNVFSSDFENICDVCCEGECNFICLPFDINDSYELVVHIQTSSLRELQRVQEHIPIIKNYFELARPVLESKMLMQILTNSTLVDPMTELYNRRFLDNFMDEDLKDRDRQFAILMIDVDFFKQVNDNFGHDVGDRVLKVLAEVLKKETKGSDMAIRYGGEEFMVLLFDVSQENALAIADKIRISFSNKQFNAQDKTFSKTLSVGVSMYPDQIDTPWHAIKYADVALYEAKNTGRNKVILFEDGMYKEEEF
ncbi:diguanylate cyclase [Sulfurimonas sp.]|uniref:GGDEF domain-containing protein n=1 Tax=Sulfurimonas sp. TaxID=2022749 RepID=UPI003564BB00